MQPNKRACGSKYEEQACNYLSEHGFTILERNFYAKHGEIDIIAKKGEYLCFVEVKYRKDTRYGSAMESVSYYKQRAICLSAREYLYKKHLPESTPIRFDVIAIQGEVLSLMENAFEYHI